MYNVDDLDEVIELKPMPQSSVGAPNPIIVAGEHDVFLTYYLEDRPQGWDGTSVRVVGTDTPNEPAVVVTFNRCTAHYFGPPNDEAFSGHPLSSRGLHPYGVFQINNSSWVRTLEKMNSVHPSHDKVRFLRNKNHYVFSFHDSTFECIAEKFTIEDAPGSVKNIACRMIDSIR